MPTGIPATTHGCRSRSGWSRRSSASSSTGSCSVFARARTMSMRSIVWAVAAGIGATALPLPPSLGAQATAGPAATAPAAAPAPATAFDAYVQRGMHDWHVPGLAVAVVKDDSVVFQKAYGVQNI